MGRIYRCGPARRPTGHHAQSIPMHGSLGTSTGTPSRRSMGSCPPQEVVHDTVNLMSWWGSTLAKPPGRMGRTGAHLLRASPLGSWDKSHFLLCSESLKGHPWLPDRFPVLGLIQFTGYLRPQLAAAKEVIVSWHCISGAQGGNTLLSCPTHIILGH